MNSTTICGHCKRIEHCRMFLKDPHAVVSECGRYQETELHKSVREGDTETWNGYHRQVTAPKGTFERIFNAADNDNDNDI